jgi:hypothetical protein
VFKNDRAGLMPIAFFVDFLNKKRRDWD